MPEQPYCGPAGILELLAAAVSPAGRVVGVDADPAHVAMAREHASRRELAGAGVIEADARRTGLPTASFDLVHHPCRVRLLGGGCAAIVRRLLAPASVVPSKPRA